MTHLEKIMGIPDNSQKLDYLKDITYTVQMKKIDDLFFLTIKGLGIASSDKDAAAAYKKLMKLKENYFSEMIKMNSLNDVFFPDEEGMKRARIMDVIRKELIKYSAIFVFSIITVYISSSILTHMIDKSINRAVKKIEQVLYKLEAGNISGIEQLAESVRDLSFINVKKKEDADESTNN